MEYKVQLYSFVGTKKVMYKNKCIKEERKYKSTKKVIYKNKCIKYT